MQTAANATPSAQRLAALQRKANARQPGQAPALPSDAQVSGAQVSGAQQSGAAIGKELEPLTEGNPEVAAFIYGLLSKESQSEAAPKAPPLQGAKVGSGAGPASKPAAPKEDGSNGKDDALKELAEQERGNHPEPGPDRRHPLCDAAEIRQGDPPLDQPVGDGSGGGMHDHIDGDWRRGGAGLEPCWLGHCHRVDRGWHPDRAWAAGLQNRALFPQEEERLA